MKFYLSHSAQEQDLGFIITDALSGIIEIYNPFSVQRTMVDINDRASHTNALREMSTSKKIGIVRSDLKAIDQCDGMIIAWPRYEVPSIGIPMEAMYSRIKYKYKPVFSLTQDEWHKNHPWTYYVSWTIDDTLDKLIHTVSEYVADHNVSPKHGGSQNG